MIADEVERELVKLLREEASSVKQCFTTFSFQTLALSITALAASFGARKFAGDAAAYIPLPAIALLAAVCRIGIHKYATANRNYGYELHLARTAHIEKHTDIGEFPLWDPSMRTLRWEEALRAWRIVQPTLFRRIYRTAEDRREPSWILRRARKHRGGWINHLRWDLYRLTKDAAAVCENFESRSKRAADHDAYPWFSPGRLVRKVSGEEGYADYYAGSYLKGMISVLTLTQVLMLLPLATVLVRPFFLEDAASGGQHWIHLAVMGVISALIFLRSLRVKRRRVILEDELLSIHSCAIVWQAVVLAHFQALRSTDQQYYGYTEALAAQAEQLAEDAFKLHAWLSRVAAIQTLTEPSVSFGKQGARSGQPAADETADSEEAT